MKVAVASKNPVKVAAAKKAFEEYFPDETIEYVSLSTDSGVGKQPMNATETATGACRRAENARDSGADFAVGIEGGLSVVTLDNQEYAFEQTWACILDTKTGLSEIGSGPAYPLPHNVVVLIKQGKTLTDAMAIEYGTIDLGANDGFNGWLSNNKIDRTEASKIAVFLALCGLYKEK